MASDNVAHKITKALGKTRVELEAVSAAIGTMVCLKHEDARPAL